MTDLLSQPIVETISIHAPIDRCFALSTRVELVKRTLGMNLIDSGVVNGITSGHIMANSRVVWRGWKFGLPTSHHTLITAFEAPQIDAAGERVAMFEDSQERGRFASFRHEHFFREVDGVTHLEDRVHFALPFGALGRLVARFVLAPHIRKLAQQRFRIIKELAEGDGWRDWVETRTTS